MSVHPVQVVTVQPGMLKSPADLKTEMWSSGVFDCCQDMHICCLGLWCMPCLGCKVSSEAGECLCLPLLDYLAAGFIPPISLALRSSLRERYRIQGSVPDDCCIVTCCPPCSWCQMARELKARRRTLLISTAPPVAMSVQMHPAQQLPYAPHPQQTMPPHAGLYP